MPGGRPAPPSTNLESLAGIRRATVAEVLGQPAACDMDSEPGCGDSVWHYVFGPEPGAAEIGADSVLVTTGGPWLLVIHFGNDRVASANWQGQK